MNDEISDKLKSLMSNPEALNMISSLLGSQESEKQDDANDEFLINMKNAIGKINSGSDKRVNLLNALKPYMREERISNIDKAIKLLKLTQVTSIFKDLWGDLVCIGDITTITEEAKGLRVSEK